MIQSDLNEMDSKLGSIFLIWFKYVLDLGCVNSMPDLLVALYAHMPCLGAKFKVIIKQQNPNLCIACLGESYTEVVKFPYCNWMIWYFVPFIKVWRTKHAAEHTILYWGIPRYVLQHVPCYAISYWQTMIHSDNMVLETLISIYIWLKIT